MTGRQPDPRADGSGRFDRRTFLRTGLGAAVTGLAGCTDGSDSPLSTADDGDDGSTPTEDGGATPTGDDAAPTATGSPTERGMRWEVRYGMTASEYQSKFGQFVDGEGLRLVDVSGYGGGSEDRYAAIWADVAGPAWRANHGLTPSGYDAKFQTYKEQGFRPTGISAYTSGGTPRFAGIWEAVDGHRWSVRRGLTAAQYQSVLDDHVDRGYRPTDVTGYVRDGEAHYAAIFEQFGGPRWRAHHGISGSTFQSKFDGYVDDDFRLTDVGGLGVGGSQQLVGTWQEFGGPEWRAYYGMDGSAFQTRIDDLSERGFRMTTVSGYDVGGPRFAGIWERNRPRQSGLGGIDDAVSQYMRDNRVPGLSLAVSKDERLVYARGYGYANREADRPMHPGHQLRVASISKPITAAAVLTLMEDGKLALDDEVFGSGGLLGTNYGTPDHGYTSGSDTTQITVHHLLQHSSGWGQGQPPDNPMFRNPGMDHTELIRWALDERSLQFRPGSDSAYSNFGYSLLGRVIETVTGQDYETYVRNAVLQPAGADGMVIAGDTRSERRSDEGAYYDGSAYEMPVARMDAHGGWVATPTELLRLTVRLDGFSNKPDILGSAAMTELADREGAWKGYGEGWFLGSSRRDHNGCFDGSIGVLVRRDDGISFAALVNTRPPDDGCGGTLKSTLDRAVSNVGTWPAWDLF
jgi:CubicO group peptidase (beta-lactamase class C family)